MEGVSYKHDLELMQKEVKFDWRLSYLISYSDRTWRIDNVCFYLNLNLRLKTITKNSKK